MNTLHLFAGAGGGLLADLILGHTPIGAVEIDPYCCQLLREKKESGWWQQLQVHEIDIRKFDPSKYAGRVDCVSGGFPCQDVSAAGRGAGITGERSGLWSEYVRVLCVLRPRYAFIENSPMLTLRGLDVVLSDLAALGYDAQWAVLSAADVGAPHLRERIWILANARSGRRNGPGEGQVEQSRGAEAIGASEAMANANGIGKLQPERRIGHQRRWISNCGSEVADAMRQRLEGIKQTWPETWPVIRDGSWWATEPAMGRVVNGLAHRTHRLKALGNGQVPLQAAFAWKILSQQLLVR